MFVQPDKVSLPIQIKKYLFSLSSGLVRIFPVFMLLFSGGCWFISAEPPAVAPVKVQKYEGDAQTDIQLFEQAKEHSRGGGSFKILSKAVSEYEELLRRIDAPGYHSQLDLFEVKWRFCRTIFYMSELIDEPSEKIRWIIKGEELSEQVISLNPQRVEGYYYIAVFKGRRAETANIGLTALKLAKKVEEYGLKAKSIDETFSNEGPLRLLALLYAKAPPWPTSIGDMDDAFENAQRALELSDYPMNHLVMAEVLIEDDEPEDAIDELHKVLSANKEGDWAWEGEQWRPYAMGLLKKIKK